jgi:hypothetical protein
VRRHNGASRQPTNALALVVSLECGARSTVSHRSRTRRASATANPHVTPLPRRCNHSAQLTTAASAAIIAAAIDRAGK